MTVKDFYEANKDILLAPVSSEEFQQLSDGMVVFCVSNGGGNKPTEERIVRAVGYRMVVAMERNTSGEIVTVGTVGLTANGYAKVEWISADDIAEETKLVYRCKPLQAGDKRANNLWEF